MILIDVRTKEEFIVDGLNDSINISLQDLRSGFVPNYDKNTEIIVYCRSGARSETASEILSYCGFRNITNAGGLDATKKLLNI